MKINRFVETEGGGFRAIGFETEFEQVPGMAENRPVSEDDIIASVDREREQQLIQRFVSFLENKGLTVDELLTLSKERQEELRTEFLES